MAFAAWLLAAADVTCQHLDCLTLKLWVALHSLTAWVPAVHLHKLDAAVAAAERCCMVALQLEYCYFSNLLLLLEVWVAPRSSTLHKVNPPPPPLSLHSRSRSLHLSPCM